MYHTGSGARGRGRGMDVPEKGNPRTDPVARSIKREQNNDARPSAEEMAAKKERMDALAEKLAKLASDGVFLKDREQVQHDAEARGWDDVVDKADSAGDQEWSHLVGKALDKRDE